MVLRVDVHIGCVYVAGLQIRLLDNEYKKRQKSCMVCVLLVSEWRAGCANEIVPSNARPACSTSITNS